VGQTVRERAEALIEVAHPDFRSELVASAKAKKYVLSGQRVPRPALSGEESRRVRLDSGTEVTLRLVRMSDEDALQDLLYRVSEESSYQRFFGHVSKPSHEELLCWADVDYDRSVALVATTPTPAGEEIVALGRYDTDPATRFAEVSLLVVDDWQSRGVGTALFRRLAEIARARGAAGFRADVLVHNARMLAIFDETGNPVESTLSGGVYRVKMPFS
jgi:GNAT superfamily N-acetyltransferase